MRILLVFGQTWVRFESLLTDYVHCWARVPNRRKLITILRNINYLNLSDSWLHSWVVKYFWIRGHYYNWNLINNLKALVEHQSIAKALLYGTLWHNTNSALTTLAKRSLSLWSGYINMSFLFFQSFVFYLCLNHYNICLHLWADLSISQSPARHLNSGKSYKRFNFSI